MNIVELAQTLELEFVTDAELYMIRESIFVKGVKCIENVEYEEDTRFIEYKNYEVTLIDDAKFIVAEIQ